MTDIVVKHSYTTRACRRRHALVRAHSRADQRARALRDRRVRRVRVHAPPRKT